jgi:hypothetical protein
MSEEEATAAVTSRTSARTSDRMIDEGPPEVDMSLEVSASAEAGLSQGGRPSRATAAGEPPCIARRARV